MTIPVSTANPNKIKGGKWTVAKFFCVSVAFTIVWMAICSELGYYKLLYGPVVLLQMNIAYFLPSIPLLVVSSLYDEVLDRRFGVAKTILIRLLIGLVGAVGICAAFPFWPLQLPYLLGSIIALGLVSGIAFSASYQLVSRFANKNTISLGLGCVGSGVLVLLLEIGLQIDSHPTRLQSILLFEIVAGFVLLGLAAAVSLLLRHWKAIEASTPKSSSAAPQGADSSLHEPLVQYEDALEVSSRALSVDSELGELHRPRAAHRKSVSALLMQSPLDFLDTVSTGENALVFDGTLKIPDSPFGRKSSQLLDGLGSDPLRRSRSFPAEPLIPARSKRPATATGVAAAGTAGGSGAGEEEEGRGPVLDVVARIWPTLLALFLSGVVGILVFPFFTYVPSSGFLGNMLPKTLFFARLFADIAGRMIPRIKALSLDSQPALVCLAAFKVACMPIFFVYLKSPERYHHDLLAVGYVVFLWALNGCINTNSYVIGPRLVSVKQKAMAAGALAISYQVAHVVGLGLAIAVCVSMFDVSGLV